MRILITGGAGFMGSHMIRYLLNKYPECEIINLDKLTYAGNLDNLKDVTSDVRYRFIHGDIAHEQTVRELIPQCDIVLNYAAETHVDRSLLDLKDFINTDIMGVYTLLEAIRMNPVLKFIQVSTDEVYGSVAEGKFTEESFYHPNNPYAISKTGGDLLCSVYANSYDLPIIITHGCNVFGPNQYPEKLIPLFITNLLEEKKVPLYGDGQNVREWLYVTDHCAAMDLLIHQGKPGQTYNIGSGMEKTNLEVTNLLLREFNLSETRIEFIKDRQGHDQRYSSEFSKLHSLGWSPAISFEEGLRLTIQWYKHNFDWWKKIKSGEYRDYYNRQYLKR